MQKRQGQQYENIRKILWGLLDSGALKHRPDIENNVRLALASPNSIFTKQIYQFLRTENLFQPQQPEKEQTLWKEPRAEQLTGDISLGHTPISKHPAHIKKAFLGNGYFALNGPTGCGKSFLLNLIDLELKSHDIPVTSFDTMNQSAALQVRNVNPDKLGVIDFQNYRRNPLVGIGHPSDWIRAASDHLADSLHLSHIAIAKIHAIAEELLGRGDVPTIPKVLEKLRTGKYRGSAYTALESRLTELTLSGVETFNCDKGFDLSQMQKKSIIFHLKGAKSIMSRLISNDYLFYMIQNSRARSPWKLTHTFAYHEASSHISQTTNADSFFIRTAKECRNYGIGLILATQAPQLEHPLISSNVGTRLIFRQEDPAGVEKFRVQFGLTPEHKTAMMNLPDRTILVKRKDIPYPFLVRIPNLL